MKITEQEWLKIVYALHDSRLIVNYFWAQRVGGMQPVVSPLSTRQIEDAMKKSEAAIDVLRDIQTREPNVLKPTKGDADD